jgi:L-ascorbate metabolism protein UlaG (beta-lactamase superfamily)
VLQAAQDLGAKRIFPVHSGKFPLANHPWDEPLEKITSFNKDLQIPLVTPLIGELVNLNAPKEEYAPWWVGLE